MITRFLAGAACAALLGLAVPVSAATSPELPARRDQVSPVGGSGGRRLLRDAWQRAAVAAQRSADSSAARELIGILRAVTARWARQRSGACGSGAGADGARPRRRSRRAAAPPTGCFPSPGSAMSRRCSGRPSGMIYADSWVQPRRDSPMQILQRTAAAPSLAAYVRSVSQVNPLYAQLRDAAWTADAVERRSDRSARAHQPRPGARTAVPEQIRHGRCRRGAPLHDRGRPDRRFDEGRGRQGRPQTQTPMLASTIYYATLNPYWHVAPELVRSLIAKNVLDQGVGYLTSRGYQVMSGRRRATSCSIRRKSIGMRSPTAACRSACASCRGRPIRWADVKFGFPNAY